MAIITVNKIQVHYNDIVALEDVSFQIEKNEFVGIVGPNGGGKTTLIKAILGLIKPTQGLIEIQQDAVLGYVPQQTSFDRHFPISVRDVILTGHLPGKFKIGYRYKEHDHQHALAVMNQLKIQDLAKRQIGQLSGGQLQRVLIARALMKHPTILVLDEPTASVDEETKTEIYNMLKILSKEMTIIMISHDMGYIETHVDRILYINKTAHCHDERMGYDDDHKLRFEKCPIDWFSEGEQIQKDLLKGKDGKYDPSDN